MYVEKEAIESITPRPKKGAVLILLYRRDGEPHVVFTKRTDRVAVHKGEVCFPGGSYEPDDPSLAHTALRETAEELGVELSESNIIGYLDEERTFGSNFVIKAYVAFIDGPPEFRPDPFEVAEVFDAPLSSLLDASAFSVAERETDGVRRMEQTYRYKNFRIWGATARLLRQFLGLYESKVLELPVETVN